jgi:5-methylcytosine-specific restriction enzyme A
MGKWANLYQLTSWKKLRASHLRRNPLCAMCLESGVPNPGRVADHITPHRGDLTLFFNPANLQTLCTTHHNADKQRMEVRGFNSGTDESGTPTDPNHPWNRGSSSRG